MKAKVVSIESGSEHGSDSDKERRIKIKFVDADVFFSSIKVRESALGIAGLKLDDELDVGFTPTALYEGLSGEGLKGIKDAAAKAKREGLLR